MFKDITASLVAATRKVVEASSAKAANEAAQNEQSSNLSKSMRPAYEGSAPRNAMEISLLREMTHTIPKTPKEKSLAALAEPKDKITHADVMTGRGVKKEEAEVVTEAKVGENEHVKVTHTIGDREDVYTVHDKKTGRKNKYGIHGYFIAGKEKPQDTIKKQLKQQNVPTAAHDMIVKHMTEAVARVNEAMTNSKPGKTSAFDYKSPRKPQDAPNRKSGDVTSTGHNVKKISTGTVYTKKFEEVEQIDEISTKLLAKAAHSASDPSKHYDDDEKYHDAQKFADHAKKTKDAKSAAAVQGAADAKGHYPRPNQARGYDSLAYRSPSRVTAAGKANKQDIKTLKSKLKNEELDAISEAPVDGVAPGSLENDGHLCASKVMHKEWKEGTTLFSQHAEPNEIGLIEWYDVMFEHGIEKKVPTRDLEIMVSESHMNHTKKKKM